MWEILKILQFLLTNVLSEEAVVNFSNITPEQKERNLENDTLNYPICSALISDVEVTNQNGKIMNKQNYQLTVHRY